MNDGGGLIDDAWRGQKWSAKTSQSTFNITFVHPHIAEPLQRLPVPKEMSYPIVIVTGANRGIGLALCNKILADPSLAPLRLLAASRKGEDFGLQAQHKDVKVQYPKLDISDSGSIKAFAEHVKSEGGEGNVRALINNAGINVDDKYSPENARKTLDVNFRGTLEVWIRFDCTSSHGCVVTRTKADKILGSDVPTLSTFAQQIYRPHRQCLLHRLKARALQQRDPVSVPRPQPLTLGHRCLG